MSVNLLPGAPLTPEVHLHMLLENLQGVKGLIVLAVEEHGSVDITSSSVTLVELAFASLRLSQYTDDAVRGKPEEGATISPTEQR